MTPAKIGGYRSRPPLLRTSLGSLELDNPLMSASGTFGAGLEASAFGDLATVGALVSKTVTPVPWHGNPPQRIVETPAGMLNSIGLENKGADYFLAHTLPAMRRLGPPVIVNIGGHSIEDFVTLAERFSAAGVDALEVNLSCPNVQGGRLLFSTDPKLTETAMRQVKAVAGVPVFAKLSPNVTSIADMAKAAEQGGADGITAINTLIGMAVDWRRGRAVLGRTIGGLSGPAIRPVALRMVFQIRQAVSLPILGLRRGDLCRRCPGVPRGGCRCRSGGHRELRRPDLHDPHGGGYAPPAHRGGHHRRRSRRSGRRPGPARGGARPMKLDDLSLELLTKAVAVYWEEAYAADSRAMPKLAERRAESPAEVLALFQKEVVEAGHGQTCVRYTMRLGNRNYPFMKLLLQEHLIAGEFFFAVDTHDRDGDRARVPGLRSSGWRCGKLQRGAQAPHRRQRSNRRGSTPPPVVRRAAEARDQECDGGRGVPGWTMVLIVDDEEDLAAETVEVPDPPRKGFHTCSRCTTDVRRHYGPQRKN